MSASKNYFKKLVFETLVSLGGKKAKEDAIKFIKKGLIIKDENGIKYTVDSVKIEDGDPYVVAFRYDPNGMRAETIEIDKSKFKDYEPV